MVKSNILNLNGTKITLKKGEKYILCISPDMATFYPIVQLFKKYNPIFISAGEHIDLQDENIICLRKEPFASVQELARELLHSKKITRLIDTLRTHQGDIWVKMWCNHIDLQSFFDEPGIKSLGFSPKDAQWLNNKIFQYELLRDIVPIAEFKIVNKEEALYHFDKLKTQDGVFTLLAFGGAGSGARIHATKNDLALYLQEINDEKLILAKIIKKKGSPSIDILVANEKEIIVFCLADQVLNGLQCLGATYPTILDNNIKKKCYTLARNVAIEIAKKDMRGYFNIDMIIDENNNVFFSEINGRYAGTTANRLWSMEQSRPSNHPSILDLEVMAIRDKTFHGFKLWNEPEQLFWYKRLLRSEYDGIISSFTIDHDIKKIYEKGEGAILIGQLIPKTKVMKHTSELGNLVIVEKSRKALNEAIKRSSNLLNKYVGIIDG